MGSAAHYVGIRIDIQIQKEFKLMVENNDISTEAVFNTIEDRTYENDTGRRTPDGWWTTIMRRHPKTPNTGGSSRASSLA